MLPQQQQQQPEVAESSSLGYTTHHELLEHAASPGAGFVSGGDPVVVALTLNMDLNKVSDVEGLKRDIGADVSRALGPDVRQVPQKSPLSGKKSPTKEPSHRKGALLKSSADRQVRVIGLRAGSIIVDLEITPHAHVSGRDIGQQLVEQAKDPSSALMQGESSIDRRC